MTIDERGSKTPSVSQFNLSALMNPQHANPLGNVHGGVIMKLVDEAGGIVAMRHAGRPVVTVAVDSMTFINPIIVGHLVTCRGMITYAGRTSMEVRVEVIAENPYETTPITTNIAYVVYVALDESGRPTPVPQLDYQTPEEERRGTLAAERQAFRRDQRRREQEAQP